MTTSAQIGGNWTRLLRSPIPGSMPGIRNTGSAGTDPPPSNNYLLMLAAVIVALLAVACSQLPEKWGIKCTVEPKPVESPAPHDAPTTTSAAWNFLEA